MDIIFVIWLLYSNGKVAINRGHNPKKYRLITVALCFGLEILGSVVGMIITLFRNPESKSLALTYSLGILGIVIGTVWSRMIVNRAPIENQSENPYAYQGMNAQKNQETQYRRVDSAAYMMQGERLDKPATIHIINEYFWNDDARDLFFLNGVPVCTVQAGKEYSFLISSVKNVLSIGRPDYPTDDIEHSIRFVAAESGYIEITVKGGKIVTDKFKNLKAK